MADTKISALTADTAPDRVADYVPTYDASAVATKKVLLSSLGGWSVQFTGGAVFNPADATTYYFSPFAAGGLTTSTAANKLYALRAGKLVKARIILFGVNGSAETSTISFRLNDTTDTTISSTLVCNTIASGYTVVNSALSVAIAEDDGLSIKWVTPTWVTNPTGLLYSGQLWFT